MFRRRNIILLFLIFSHIFCEKKDEDDLNTEELVQIYTEADEPIVEIVKGADVIKIVPAPDLSKEEPRFKVETPDKDVQDDSKIRRKINSLDTELVKMFYKSLEDKYPQYTTNKEYQNILPKFIDSQHEEKKTDESDEPNQNKEAEDIYKKAIEMFREVRPRKIEGLQALLKANELGHKKAKALIAWEYLFGTELPQNITYAKETFEELAAIGVSEAHMGLGFLYSTGIGVNASQPRALVHYTFAALSQNPWAQMVLGYRHWSGVTLSSDCESALNYYRLVANKVASEVSLSGGPVVQRIRLLEETENPSYSTGIMDKDLLDYYQMLADKGDVQAQVGLGQLHYQGGRGVELDSQKALHYFMNAADAGNPVAVAFLGKMYLEGNEYVKQDNKTAFEYFKKAADLGNPVGQSGLGLMYLYGRGVPKDYEKALNFFTLAADQGWVDGQLHLGIMYFGGLGVKRDYKLANKYFTLASQAGHVLAFYNLAQMHATGTGVMRSCPTAAELYKNVAERGRWSSHLMDAHYNYKRGRVNQAFIKYALLAEMGYEVAQSNAAFLLDRGEVTMWPEEFDQQVRALMYWSRAAGQGYSAAQVKLGDYYYYGLGTNVDYETAAMHYRIASDHQHNAQAMFNLGYMHEQGLGMEQDMYLAKRCYDLAAETSPDAKIPVALALIKLSLYFSFKYFKEKHLSNWYMLLNLDYLLRNYWDLYLLAVLVFVLFCTVYRRPNH